MEDGFVKEPAVATRKDFDPKSVTPRTSSEHQAGRRHPLPRERRRSSLRSTPRRPTRAGASRSCWSSRRTRRTPATCARSSRPRISSAAATRAGHPVDSQPDGRGERRSDRAAARAGDATATESSSTSTSSRKAGTYATSTPSSRCGPRHPDILTEQTLGRGLRLPYGERTGVEAVER